MKTCNICHKNNNVFHKLFRDYPVTNLYLQSASCDLNNLFDIDIYQCICGHVFALSQHTNIYSSSYAYNGNAEGVLLRRAVGLSMLQDQLGDSDLNCLIDIGGGQLQMTKAVMQKWKTLRQIVIDPVPIELSENQLGSIEFLNEYFDGTNFDIKNNSNPSLYILDNVLEHIHNLSAFMDGLVKSSNENDFIYVCVPSLEVIFQKMQFQEIIHEHVNYFSIEVVNKLFRNSGFLCVNSFTDYCGQRGYNYHLFKKSKSINVVFKNQPMLNFENGFSCYKNILKNTLEHIGNINNPIFGVCASELTPTLAYHMRSDLAFCEFIFDTSEHKAKKYMPLIRPQIISFDEIKSAPKNSYFYITAPAVAKRVAMNLTSIGLNNIIFPINIM